MTQNYLYFAEGTAGTNAPGEAMCYPASSYLGMDPAGNTTTNLRFKPSSNNASVVDTVLVTHEAGKHTELALLLGEIMGEVNPRSAKCWVLCDKLNNEIHPIMEERGIMLNSNPGGFNIAITQGLVEKFIYIRNADAAVDNNNDDDTGGVLYPISHLLGMCCGTSNNAGVITGDDNAFSVFFKPIKYVVGAEADDLSKADIFVFATAQDAQIDVMRNFVSIVNDQKSGFITLYDGGNGETGRSRKINGITGCTTIIINESED